MTSIPLDFQLACSHIRVPLRRLLMTGGKRVIWQSQRFFPCGANRDSAGKFQIGGEVRIGTSAAARKSDGTVSTAWDHKRSRGGTRYPARTTPADYYTYMIRNYRTGLRIIPFLIFTTARRMGKCRDCPESRTGMRQPVLSGPAQSLIFRPITAWKVSSLVF